MPEGPGTPILSKTADGLAVLYRYPDGRPVPKAAPHPVMLGYAIRRAIDPAHQREEIPTIDLFLGRFCQCEARRTITAELDLVRANQREDYPSGTLPSHERHRTDRYEHALVCCDGLTTAIVAKYGERTPAAT